MNYPKVLHFIYNVFNAIDNNIYQSCQEPLKQCIYIEYSLKNYRKSRLLPSCVRHLQSEGTLQKADYNNV